MKKLALALLLPLALSASTKETTNIKDAIVKEFNTYKLETKSSCMDGKYNLCHIYSDKEQLDITNDSVTILHGRYVPVDTYMNKVILTVKAITKLNEETARDKVVDAFLKGMGGNPVYIQAKNAKVRCINYGGADAVQCDIKLK